MAEKFDPSKPSADAEAMADYLEKVEHVLGGADVMRDNFALYCPKFPNETAERFSLRRELSRFTNIFGDVVEALASKPFAREVQVVEGAGRVEEFVEDIDGRGNHLNVFSGAVFYQAVADSITWIRVDYPDAGEFANRAEEMEAGLRPYFCHVKHSAILAIESRRSGGGERLEYIRMWEGPGEILELWPNRWRRWHKSAETGEWVSQAEDGEPDEGPMTLGVVPMVPVILGRRKGRGWRFRPPMRDALDLQLELFDLESSKRFVEKMGCFPVLAANGVEPDRDEQGKPRHLDYQPDTVLYAPPDAEGRHGSWAVVEPGVQTLTHLQGVIDGKVDEIRELGRQPLTAQSGNLTRISAQQSASKGNSAVQQWADQLKDAIENALTLANRWMDDTTEPEADVFKDFRAVDDAAETPKHLLAMRERGDLSRLTLWDEMRRLNELSDRFSPEEEQQRLADELPGGGDFSGPDGPPL